MNEDESMYQKFFHEVEKIESRSVVLRKRLLRKEKNSENYKKALAQITKKEEKLKRKKELFSNQEKARRGQR